MILETLITCPACAKKTQETMLENACLGVYRCPHCETQLTTKKCACCVFCSYGDIPCPSAQLIGSACCGEFTS